MFDILRTEILKRPGATLLLLAAGGALLMGAVSFVDSRAEAAVEAAVEHRLVKQSDFTEILVRLARIEEKLDRKAVR